MACESWLSQLDTYLDGELPADQMRALDAHLRTCPSCSADALARVQMKRAIKSAAMRYTPSAELRSRIQKMMGATAPRRGWSLGWQLATAALAILVLAGVSTVYWGKQTLGQQQMYSELADLHVATLAS